jgi:hypothetical protein
MWERIKHMLIKEFIQIFRDPRMKAVRVNDFETLLLII